jgi:hypothetical protein
MSGFQQFLTEHLLSSARFTLTRRRRHRAIEWW